jgi:hypothetical protein
VRHLGSLRFPVPTFTFTVLRHKSDELCSTTGTGVITLDNTNDVVELSLTLVVFQLRKYLSVVPMLKKTFGRSCVEGHHSNMVAKWTNDWPAGGGARI